MSADDRTGTGASPTGAPRSRDATLDIARGIAMVLVVLSHVLRGLYASNGVETGFPWEIWLDRVLYLTHLPVFVFVTGLLLPRGVERLGRGRYLWERLSQFAYVYILWTLIQGTAEVLTSPWKNNPASWEAVLTVWSPIGHLWFIPTLAVATVVVVVVRPWRGTASSGVMTAVALALSVGLWGVTWPIAGGGGLALTAWLLVGAFVTQPRLAFAVEKASAAVLAGGALLASAVLMTVPALLPVTAPTIGDVGRTAASVALGVVCTAAGVAGVLGISVVAARCPGFWAWLALIGRRSLQIYLAHIIFASGTRVVLVMVGITSFPVHAVLGTLAGVVGPLLLVMLTTGTMPWLFTRPGKGWVRS